jgi:hypothetical protein
MLNWISINPYQHAEAIQRESIRECTCDTVFKKVFRFERALNFLGLPPGVIML